jgi:hypothetical protein
MEQGTKAKKGKERDSTSEQQCRIRPPLGLLILHHFQKVGENFLIFP